jgi:hypothetical protein
MEEVSFVKAYPMIGFDRVVYAGNFLGFMQLAPTA